MRAVVLADDASRFTFEVDKVAAQLRAGDVDEREIRDSLIFLSRVNRSALRNVVGVILSNIPEGKYQVIAKDLRDGLDGIIPISSVSLIDARVGCVSTCSDSMTFCH